MAVTIYHNPRCTKSRETLKLLQDKGVEPEIIEYLKTPPDAKTLSSILDKLGLEPRDLMRKKEAPYKARKLDDPKLTRKQLIEAMIADPVLIERPIVLSRGKAAVGRPPESVLKIL
jgi:arsenate reductase (glutaredoxin)